MAEITELIKRYGLGGLIRKAQERSTMKEEYSWPDYAPHIDELDEQESHNFPYNPKISIIVPCYNTREDYLLDLVRSVKAQSYSNWELILMDASERPLTKLDELHNSNIVVRHLPKNYGISDNTNEGFAYATGEFIGFMDHDDFLSPNALFEMVAAINAEYANDWDRLLLYSDEDKVSDDGQTFFYPHFKLDYNKELIRHYNYFCHFTIFSRELWVKAGSLNNDRNGSQDYDLFLRMISADAKVVHVPRILYHWRAGEGSTAGKGSAKMYAYVAGVQSVESFLEREGLNGMVSITEDLGVYSVSYEDYPGIAEEVDQLYPATLCETVASVVIYKGERVKEVRVRSYNYNDSSKSRNRNSNGLRTDNWRALLASYLNEPDVAIAMSRSVKNGKVWQNGLSFDVKDGEPVTTYNFQGLSEAFKGYMNRAFLPQDVDGFPPECALVAKTEILQEFGAIDPTLPPLVAIRELCERIHKAGYRIVVVPQVEAILKD